jgi:hypothetical protein
VGLFARYRACRLEVNFALPLPPPQSIY